MPVQPLIQHFAPCSLLRSIVSNYIVRRQEADLEQVWLWPAFPQQFILISANNKLKFTYDDNSYKESPDITVVGPTSKKAMVVSPPGQLAVLVVLHPGVLHRLFKLPMADTVNCPIDILDISTSGKSLLSETTEKLEEIIYSDPELKPAAMSKMIQVVETFLLHLIKTAKTQLPIDRVFNMIWEKPNSYTLDQLVSLSCSSVRQFERQFLNRIGVSPKFFMRQSRFAHAFMDKLSHPNQNWASIALNNGYYDQMHFVKDFKSFAASPPAGFFDMLDTTGTETAYKNTLSKNIL